MTEWRALAGIHGRRAGAGRGEARVLEVGGHGLLLEVRFPAGVASVRHRHSHDSYLYLLSGHITGTVADRQVELRPGATLVHPAGVDHTVHAVVDSQWLEFKAPAPNIVEADDGSLAFGP